MDGRNRDIAELFAKLSHAAAAVTVCAMLFRDDPRGRDLERLIDRMNEVETALYDALQEAGVID